MHGALTTPLPFLLFLIAVVPHRTEAQGLLYPRQSETRTTRSLNGIWNFSVQNSSAIDEELLVTLMPVPASYNEISTSWNLREYVGVVQYERNFFVPKSWADGGQRIWIRFGSVNYGAEVLINGELALNHTIGHLPFEAEITSLLKFNESNEIVVRVDNRLDVSTVPQGSVTTLSSGRLKHSTKFDFFHHAGIDRPVTLYTTPRTYIDDITTKSVIGDVVALIQYNVSTVGPDDVTARVTLLDKSGLQVANDTRFNGSLTIEQPKLWWPYLMDPNPGYLYTLQVELLNPSGSIVDVYRQAVAIRTITWDSNSLMINSVPVYLKGFGRHEDSNFRGTGLDLPLIVRDFRLLKWVGANTLRTSYYPYSEEVMDLADQLGFMVINEIPAYATNHHENKDQLANHKRALTDLIQRDKNRPSVIIWSVGYNPSSQNEATDRYYKDVLAHVRSLDSRPVTMIDYRRLDGNDSTPFGDIMCWNQYEAWLDSEGDLDVIVPKVLQQARELRETHKRPIIITEYGADSQEGLHLLPTYIWTEEYQVKLLSEHFKAFDELRKEGYFIGEFAWNFADYLTHQDFLKNGGSKMGVFTRNRQPKSSANLIRKRYWSLSKSSNEVDLPDDLDDYTCQDC